MDSYTDVCRLCSSTHDLLWVFDKKLPGAATISLKDIIFAISGVEIFQNDIVSQKICSKCCQISMKMFQFREQSMKNDQILKNRYAEMLINSKVKLKIPNTNITISAEKVEPKQESKTEVSKTKLLVHPSITELFKYHPQIRLPSVCLNSNISTYVSLEMNAVEKYFRDRKLDMQKYCQFSSKCYRRIAKKKGSAKPLSKPKASEVPEKAIVRKKVIDPQRKEPDDTVKSVSTTVKNNTPPHISIIVKEKKSVETISVPIKNVKEKPTSEDSNTSNKRKLTSEDSNTSNKRILTPEDSSAEKNLEKPTFIESLGLTPKKKSNCDTTGTLYLDKSVPLFMCDICNSLQYSAKELKRHKLKHLKCQFCKLKFKSIDWKLIHIDKYCKIKNMMNNLPAVELEKVEFNIKVRNEYSDAFCSFPPIPGLKSDNEIGTKDPENSKSLESTEVSPSIMENSNISMINTPEVIEILSDEEDSALPPVCSTSTIPHHSGTSQNIVSNTFGQAPTASKKDIPVTAPPSGVLKSNVDRISAPVDNPATPTNVEQNIPSYIVKPDIKIRNAAIVDIFDHKASDAKVVKDLLTKFQLVQSQSETTTQTDLPSNDSITVNSQEITTELKNLRHQLLIYKIPVFITKGEFKVSYEYKSATTRVKKRCLWNDLICNDLKKIDNGFISSKTTSFNSNHEYTKKSLNNNNSVIIQNSSNIQVSGTEASVGQNISKISSVCSELSKAIPVQTQSSSSYIQTSSSITVPQVFNTIGNDNPTLSSTGLSSIQHPSNNLCIQSDISISSTPVFNTVNTGTTMIGTSESLGLSNVWSSSNNSFIQKGSTCNTSVLNTGNIGTTNVSNTGSPEMRRIQPASNISFIENNAAICSTSVPTTTVGIAGSSKVSCVPAPSNTSFIQNSNTVGSTPVFDATSNGSTTLTTSRAPEVNCLSPSFRYTGTTAVPQLKVPASFNTFCILPSTSTNANNNILANCDNLTERTSFATENTVPTSVFLAPVSDVSTPASAALNDFSVTPTATSELNSVSVSSKVGIRVKDISELT
ncbi:uncharacterized protein isoform X2 [Leptinotarsa decemlineata]|uniref:uncharacterized protein isoform X2 n=1 Tax=Leptinotarsa decemlineata TaxID=7539 RepID=UPI003D30901A